jgi:protoporphyrinogen oxidase
MYPVAIGDVVKNAGLITSVRAGFSFLWAAVRYAAFNRPIRNMKTATRRQFGSTLYEMFFRRTPRRFGASRAKSYPPTGSRNAARDCPSGRSRGKPCPRGKSNVQSLIEEFMYPRDGYMRIPERMAEDIEGAGHRVLRNASVQGIVVHGPNDIEVTYGTRGGDRSIRAQHVVSTIPLSLLAQIVTPKADESVFNAARSLAFRDLITVNLQLRCKQVSKDTWLYVQDEHILFGRLHEPKNWSRAMVPDDGHTSLVLECFCAVGDAIWLCQTTTWRGGVCGT